MNAPSPFAPHEYYDRRDLAKLLRVKEPWLKKHQADLEAAGFPKPVPWHPGKRLWCSIAIALWQLDQLPEDHQALLERLLAAGQAEFEPEPDIDRVKDKIAALAP